MHQWVLVHSRYHLTIISSFINFYCFMYFSMWLLFTTLVTWYPVLGSCNANRSWHCRFVLNLCKHMVLKLMMVILTLSMTHTFYTHNNICACCHLFVSDKCVCLYLLYCVSLLSCYYPVSVTRPLERRRFSCSLTTTILIMETQTSRCVP